MQPVSTPAGEVKNQPIGDACYECFDLWRRCWKSEFASFEMMCEKYMSDKPTRARIELSRLGLRDSSSKPMVVEQASTMTGYKLTVDRRYWLLTDRDLRCLLGVAWLTKRHTNGLISTTIPAEDDPSLSETAYFFKDPARKFRTATLSMYYESGATTQEMPAADHTWEGQAISVLRATTAQHAQLGSSTILAEKEKTSYIPTLSVFLERQGISLASAAGSGMLPPVVSIGSADGSAAGDDVRRRSGWPRGHRHRRKPTCCRRGVRNHDAAETSAQGPGLLHRGCGQLWASIADGCKRGELRRNPTAALEQPQRDDRRGQCGRHDGG